MYINRKNKRYKNAYAKFKTAIVFPQTFYKAIDTYICGSIGMGEVDRPSLVSVLFSS